jgi:hypothetical protein
MGVITSDRFNPIKAYCNVRLQQGVPLVDADVNELDDIRKFEVRAFLKWFVGNGIPDGNDGFRIAAAATPAPDDFQILAGAQLPSGPVPTPPSAETNEFALHRFGRCIVDGLDVIIQANATYATQVLSTVDVNPPYSLPVVGAIPVPVSPPGPVLVYLDIWERVVSPTEDPSLVVPPLGTESCARIKRQWVVRTRLGTNVPVPGDLDFIANHLYYGLASINRRVVGGTAAPILATDITDLRERGLSLTPSTLIPDVLGGTTNAYRQGQNRPAMSLRDAINALARGEVPALPERPVNAISIDPIEASGRSTLDGSNGLVLTWAAGFITAQIFVARLDFGNPSAGFVSPQQITTGDSHFVPSVVSLPGGDLIVAYQGETADGRDIYFRRGPTPAALAAATEQKVTTSGNAEAAVIVASNNIVVFFFQLLDGFHYQRYNATTSTFLDANPVLIPGANSSFHAAVDSAGNVWGAFISTKPPAGIQTFRLNPTTGIKDTMASFPSATDDFYAAPFVLCGAGQVWVFWFGNGGIWFAIYNNAAWGPATRLPYTLDGDENPTATFDAQNQIALAYNRRLPPDNSLLNVVLAHGDPISGGWLPPTAVTVTGLSDIIGIEGIYMGGIFPGAGSLWLHWMRTNTGNYRLYYRQICSPL